jgi:hypothetical protein
MAATNYTPISLYYSSTTTNVPTNTNLVNGELAINITDGNLFYKDNANVVQIIANKDAAAGNFTTVDTTNIEVSNVKAKDGTASATIADTTGYWTFSGTGAFTTPKGNDTTERPGTPVTGMLRYNTVSNEFEGYSGASPSWKAVGGGSTISNDTSTATDVYPAFLGATSGSATTIYTSNAKLLYKPSTGELKADAPVANNGIFVNNTTVSSSYTIASGSNGMSVGPMTVGSGATVTVSSGQRWLIL